jgi:hypothetical protein
MGRGRGRPKGSKAKPKILSETADNIRLLKKQIKDMRAEKLTLPSGNERRIELGREIKKLRQILKEKKEFKVEKTAEITQANIDKEPLVVEILSLQEQYKIKPTFEDLGISLYKYTAEQLKKHIDCIKKRLNLAGITKDML